MADNEDNYMEAVEKEEIKFKKKYNPSSLNLLFKGNGGTRKLGKIKHKFKKIKHIKTKYGGNQ